MAQQISQAATQLEAVESQALMQMDAGKQTEALAMLDNEAYRSWQNYFTNAVRQFLAGQQDLAVSLRQDIRNEWRTLLIWFGGITIMTLLVCIGLLVVMTRQVLQPIARLEQAALALGRGDLEARVQVTSSDELGRLGVVFNKMAVVLNEQAMSSTERLRKITRDLGER
ncbi:MAG TPA: HAMP domain-containing protein [Candidatus Saccharimonadales bacterium]|nr:HAMP domain-containing protein [Candidatus Saccharimonadales bacterium]